MNVSQYNILSLFGIIQLINTSCNIRHTAVHCLPGHGPGQRRGAHTRGHRGRPGGGRRGGRGHGLGLVVAQGQRPPHPTVSNTLAPVQQVVCVTK